MCLLLRKCVCCWENLSIAEKMCLLLRKCVCCWENVSFPEKMCFFPEKMCLLLRKCVFCWENVSFAEKSSINLLNCVDLKALQGLGIWFYLTYTHVFVALDVLHFKTIQHLFWALVKHKWLAKFSSIFAWKLATFESMCASKNNFFSVTKWRRYVEKQENEITPSLQEYW